MFCPSCGSNIPNNSEFCPFCGSKIEVPNRKRFTLQEKRAQKPKRVPNSPAKRKRIVVFATAFALILVLGLGGYFFIADGMPYLQYTEAIRTLENGEAEKAIEMFSRLEDYKASKTYISSAYTKWIEQLYEVGEYSRAIDVYGQIKDKVGAHIPFSEWKHRRDIISKCYYALTLDCISTEKWSDAKDYFEKLSELSSNYTGSSLEYDIYTNCIESYIDLHSLSACEDAQLLLDKLKGDFASSNRLQKYEQMIETEFANLNYGKAYGFYLKGDYLDAIEVFESIDSTRARYMRRECMYKIVLEAAENGTSNYTSKLMQKQYGYNKNTVLEYAEKLAKDKYKDSEQLYSKIKKALGR